MRKLLVALFCALSFGAYAQPLVGPVPEPLSFAPSVYTEATKPSVTPANQGTLAYISDCQTGSQSPPGSGCLSYVNTNGIWVDLPSPPSASIIAGGQTLFLGQAATVQGNGPKLQLATGAFVSGHAIVFDVNGNAVDSGGAAQGGGTVSSGSAGTLATYASSGTVVSSLSTLANAVAVTNGSGNVSISTTLPTGLAIPAPANLRLPSSTFGSLPSVTTSDTGRLQWVSDCQNGSEGVGAGTGCLGWVNDAGTWVRMPSIPTQSITIGGQTVTLGGSTTNQGNGSKIQLSTGALTNGHCLQADANGNVVDSGSGCGGGGGSGTVSSGTANSLAYYAASGTTLAGLSTTNNAVLVTNGSGIPSESATLPSGLSIPSPTISNLNGTGTATLVAETLSGKLTTAASATTGSGLNIPQGVAPTSPSNGDEWCTSAACFVRLNGATQGLASTTNGGALSGTSPVAVSAAGAISCTTCATTTNGGALSGTSPIAISAAGAISLGTQPGAAVINFDANTTVHNDTYYITLKWPWATGTIDSVDAFTGGTSTPSWSLALQIAGSNVTSCNGITVNSSSISSTTCTAANSVTTGQPVTAVISSTSGNPFSAGIEVHFHRSST